MKNIFIIINLMMNQLIMNHTSLMIIYYYYLFFALYVISSHYFIDNTLILIWLLQFFIPSIFVVPVIYATFVKNNNIHEFYKIIKKNSITISTKKILIFHIFTTLIFSLLISLPLFAFDFKDANSPHYETTIMIIVYIISLLFYIIIAFSFKLNDITMKYSVSTIFYYNFLIWLLIFLIYLFMESCNFTFLCISLILLYMAIDKNNRISIIVFVNFISCILLTISIPLFINITVYQFAVLFIIFQATYYAITILLLYHYVILKNIENYQKILEDNRENAIR